MQPVYQTLETAEARFILMRLYLLKGNRTQTARTLNMGLRTLQRKLRQYGVGHGLMLHKQGDEASYYTSEEAQLIRYLIKDIPR